VLDALAAGRWPARCESELQSHVAQCPVCMDLGEVVGSLTAEHDELWSAIEVPSAGTVWWRAQVRARQEAARQASRPITVVQTAGAIVAAIAVVAVFYVSAPWLTMWIATAPELPSFELPAISLPSLASPGMWRWVAIAALITWAVIAPLAVYLAVAED